MLLIWGIEEYDMTLLIPFLGPSREESRGFPKAARYIVRRVHGIPKSLSVLHPGMRSLDQGRVFSVWQGNHLL